MTAKPSERNDTTLSSRLNEILRKTTPIFLVVLGIAVVAIIGITVFNLVSVQMKTGGVSVAEKLESDFSAWSIETDQTKKAELGETVKSGIATIAASHAGAFSYQRALLIEGSLAFEQKDFKAAVASWTKLADRFPSSYLASIALRDAAVAAEESGDIDKAISILEKLVAKYSSKAPGISHALWSIGRLYEEKGDAGKAKTSYRKLAEEYPTDENWTKLGESRILFLESQGVN